MKDTSLETKLKNIDVLFKMNLSHVHGQLVSETETSKIFSIKAIENVEDELSKYRDKMNTLLQEKGTDAIQTDEYRNISDKAVALGSHFIEIGTAVVKIDGQHIVVQFKNFKDDDNNIILKFKEEDILDPVLFHMQSINENYKKSYYGDEE
ncbi:hypothetical protein [Bacillus atrophaeus]|uniref:hypothetical protein n=1 Tax=Bacillus atrophaeus TaxID=1452 RepID=UPI00227DA544|nr:hypothetical protein [Bacillus atrophaeus]MCY7948027.1 hypothetical protein [Bacillus atrophaeus]MCY8098028.1 hypothetical protein [Bacillus atrophaeus]MCY9169952.1 hypothetical protein [Bacillus atrophaeus]MEC0740677.1 hypothetical protein [Bacillus atrophaeus]MEC0747059.1 hypothetical protein [Bacillus atrophaeus]